MTTHKKNVRTWYIGLFMKYVILLLFATGLLIWNEWFINTLNYTFLFSFCWLMSSLM